MQELQKERKPLHPVLSILVTLFAVLVGFQVIGPIIGFMISLPLFDGDIMAFQDAIMNPTQHPDFKVPMFIMQGFGTLFGLILVPLILLKINKTPRNNFFKTPVYVQPLLLVFIIVVVFMIVNSIFIEWNQSIKFPRSLSGFEEWARSTEDKLAELTKWLTTFDSTGQFILAFVVIAVLPAIGEEIVFRGMIQQDFYRATSNIHVSIWVAAILFSAIHIQFFGFVPRVLLGALFGYLYYWSGNLVMPIVAHFVNNGFTVVAMYFHQKGAIDMNIESTEAAPPSAVIFCAILTVVLLFLFKKFYHSKTHSI